MSMFDLTGKVAVVTGASSGLGADAALAYAQAGADVALLARRKEKLDAVKEQIEKLGKKVIAVQCDVTSEESVKNAIAEVYEKHGYILDPHGACGYRALEHLLEPGETGVFLETAHPAKFNSVINDVIKTEVEIPERLAAFMKGKKQSIEIGNRFEDLKKFLMADK